ncbi:glycosyltransferase family A protein [Flavobacteriaceae bacterium S356]|uniref:Glycosyltransferase family A protein n=1 Tax=Asprobacillus argus TaxID=3076534 RepID=A0ABU3LJ11_9FLAO|nr:glycosyltransferase family A protein [Flavobacteriaceae bacterium S356]
MKDLKNISVTVVIPTYKRTKNLLRLLESISSQTLIPNEIIVVAAGYDEYVLKESLSIFELPIKLIFSQPSVCHQRNTGIFLASSKFIQLCDDDIVLPKNYIEKLASYLFEHEDVKIVSGLETIQSAQHNWLPFNQDISFLGLLYKYIFGLSVWSDLSQKTSKNILFKKLTSHYLRKGNTISKAGWPILCDFSDSTVQASIYGLGCAMFHGKTLKETPYNERLGQHGIGDNYDLAIRINKETSAIHILKDVCYKHYKTTSNRLASSKQYYNRTKALLHCVRKLPIFGFSSKLYFLWSLLGNGLYFLVKLRFRHFYKNLRIMGYALISILFTKKRAY